MLLLDDTCWLVLESRDPERDLNDGEDEIAVSDRPCVLDSGVNDGGKGGLSPIVAFVIS